MSPCQAVIIRINKKHKGLPSCLREQEVEIYPLRYLLVYTSASHPKGIRIRRQQAGHSWKPNLKDFTGAKGHLEICICPLSTDLTGRSQGSCSTACFQGLFSRKSRKRCRSNGDRDHPLKVLLLYLMFRTCVGFACEVNRLKVVQRFAFSVIDWLGEWKSGFLSVQHFYNGVCLWQGRTEKVCQWWLQSSSSTKPLQFRILLRLVLACPASAILISGSRVKVKI